MTTKNSQKLSGLFYCEKCHYNAKRKSDYNKHLQTVKHINNEILQNTTKNSQKLSNTFKCDCGKIYKHHSSLYNHKKKCNNINQNNNIQVSNLENNNIQDKNNQDINYKILFLEVVKKNNEFQELLMKQQEQISELIPKIGNNNITTNKNKFNINVFLNEKCKDALSMEQFIDKIEISMKNLLTTKEKGQVQGISNIIIENMNKLSLYERPLHCTDKKRETLYIKNNTWEKDENKEHINKALKDVERKQMQNINVWLEEHPNYMNNSQEQEEFAKLLSECGKSVDDGREKIIKNVCDNIFINKEECDNQ